MKWPLPALADDAPDEPLVPDEPPMVDDPLVPDVAPEAPLMPDEPPMVDEAPVPDVPPALVELPMVDPVVAPEAAPLGAMAGDPEVVEPDPVAVGRSVGADEVCAKAGAVARAVATRQAAVCFFSMMFSSSVD